MLIYEEKLSPIVLNWSKLDVTVLVFMNEGTQIEKIAL